MITVYILQSYPTKWAADYLANLDLPKDAKILDVCAGTGLVAKHLKARGYTSKLKLPVAY